MAGSGERSGLIAEQLRLQQRGGDARTIDFDQRPVRAVAQMVHQTGDHVLPDPGFSRDEHGRIHLGQLFDGRGYGPHGPAERQASGGLGRIRGHQRADFLVFLMQSA